jgi:hypothetical protein
LRGAARFVVEVELQAMVEVELQAMGGAYDRPPPPSPSPSPARRRASSQIMSKIIESEATDDIDVNGSSRSRADVRGLA